MTQPFYIPDTEGKDNQITRIDREKGQLRVGESNKKYFPHEDCELTFIFDNIEYTCSLKTKFKSHIIKLNQDLKNQLNLKPINQLEFQRVGDRKYLVSK